MKRRNKIYTGAAVAALLMGTAVVVPQTIIPQASITASAAQTNTPIINGVEYIFNYSNNTATIAGIDDSKISFTTPEKVSYNGVDYDVTTINLYGCLNKTKLKELTITSNIKSLTVGRTYESPALEKVTIYGNPEIEAFAFSGCTALTSVILDDSMTEISQDMFSGCTNLKTIKLPSELTTIGSYAFKGCSALKSIIIPATVEAIPGEAFKDCSSLTTVTLNNGLKEIEEYAFMGCSSLKSITIPERVESIFRGAFSGCTSLTNVTLNNGLKQILSSAFEDCSALKSIVIPETLQWIDLSCFNGTSLSEFESKGATTIYNNGYDGLHSLRKVTLSGNETLGSMAFADCKNLSNLVVPISGNLDWSYNAFDNCPKLLQINGDTLTSSYIEEKYNAVFDDSKYDAFARKYFNASTNVGFVNEYVVNCCKGLADYLNEKNYTQIQKAKFLHDWVINKVDYDHADMSAARNHCDVSIFLNDKSVCEGYAKGYSLLMKAAGFDTIDFANGDHVWNKCKIDDMYFYVDTCWDDGGNISSYEWFMLSGKELIEQDTKNHHFGIEPYDSLTEISMGDLNMDKVVDEADIELLNTELQNKKNKKPGILNDKQLILADLDFNGDIDDSDFNLLNDKYGRRFDLNNDGVTDNNDWAMRQFFLTTHIAITDSTSCKADCNNDGVVNSKDAKEMRYYLDKYCKGTTTPYYRMGDLNLDGTVDKNDLIALQKFGKKNIKYNANKYLADFNRDGDVDEEDYKILKELTKHQLGDVDFSGTVDSTDKELIMKHIAKSKLLPNRAHWYADLNGDGAIDDKDLAMI